MVRPARIESVSGGVGRLTVPTRFLKSWIESHYLDRVLATFKAEAGDVTRIEVGVRGTMVPARPAVPHAAKPANPTSGPLARLHAVGTPAPSAPAVQAAEPAHRRRPPPPMRTVISPGHPSMPA